MADLVNSFEEAREHLRADESNTYDAMTRRGLESRLLQGADVAIDLGGGGNLNTRFVALSMDPESPGFTIKELDSDLVDHSLCGDHVHSLSELSFGQGNQFAPYMESFVDAVQLADIPAAVSENITAAMSDDNPEDTVVAEKIGQDISGVCKPIGM